MPLLNATPSPATPPSATSALDQAINQLSPAPTQYGVVAPIIPAGTSGNLLQYVAPNQPGANTRNIIQWFIPDVGMVSMYINPQSIDYQLKKLITPERTKGGYVIQYWGEELTTLNIQGNCGSSGVEGLNVLEQIYRSEQYLYDPIALTLAANNSISGLSNMVDSALGNLGGLGNTISNATNGILGIDPASQNVLPRNIPSLASMATGLEMYYAGWVFRGFFTTFSFSEKVERLGLFDYQMGFTVTQRRGYRTNSLGWQRSANYGPSSDGVPLSFGSFTTSK